MDTQIIVGDIKVSSRKDGAKLWVEIGTGYEYIGFSYDELCDLEYAIKRFKQKVEGEQ